MNPVVSGDQTQVELSLSVSITGHDRARDSVWPNKEVPDHKRREISTCDTRKVSNQVTVTHGGYALIAVLNPTGEDAAKDRVQLVFVRADIMASPFK